MKKLSIAFSLLTIVFILSGQNPNSFQEDIVTRNTLNALSLPFFEDWSSGSFETYNWTTDSDDWLINTEEGNEKPSAEFRYIPDNGRNYSYELESDFFDATELKLGRIIFQFEVKLKDSTTLSNEHLIVEVYDGEHWLQVVSFFNSQLEDWEHHSVEITDKVLGKEFKIRFIAKGTNPTGSLSWFIDNVSLYRVCDEPTNLTGSSYWNSSEDKGIKIIWDVPTTAVNEWYNWIRYDNNVNNSSLGLVDGGDVSVAIRWDSNQLLDYEGDTMRALKFFIADSGFSQVVAKIWTGNDAENLIYYDTLKEPLYNAWNELSIDTLLILDASQEYWVGYRIIGQEANTNPIGYHDHYPGSRGYGDMVSLDEDENIWDELSALSDFISLNIQLKLIDIDTISKCIGFNINRKLYNEDDYSLVGFVPNHDFMEHPSFKDTSVKSLQETCYKVSSLWANEGDTCISAFAESISQTEDYICSIFSSIQNNKPTYKFTIYPNPASGILNFKGEFEVEEINIYNFSGQKVLSKTSPQKNIDVSILTHGLYIAELKLENQIVLRQKLIIM